MRIALASCKSLPDWEVDDAPFEAALRERGVEIAKPAWDDASIRWSDFDACLIRTTWDYSEKRDAFVSWAECVEKETRLFNPASMVEWNTDKRYLKTLAERGVATIETVWVESGKLPDVAKVLDERGWHRAFIKPVVGASSRATLRFDDSAEGIAAATNHLRRYAAQEAMMIQPYLAKVEQEGEYSVIFIDSEPTHSVRKIPVPGDYRVQDDYGASDEPYAITQDEMATARRAYEAIGEPLLYARTDFLRGDDGRLLLTELEAVEPSLFFRHGHAAADALADALIRKAR